MFTVRVQDSFAAAHFLKEYQGKCENLHGHNYKIRVYARAGELGKGGMLIDFGILKKALKEVLGGLDHSPLNEHAFFKRFEPSAEYIALYIFQELKRKLPDCPLSQVDVFETDINMASYSPDF